MFAEHRRAKRLSVTVAGIMAVLLGVACDKTPTSPTSPASRSPFLAFTSTPGDLIGLGRTERIDLTAPGVRLVAGLTDNNRLVTVRILDVPRLSPMVLTLGAAPGQTLARGVYPNARFGLNGVSLSFGVAASACESIGEFEVLDVAMRPSAVSSGFSGGVERLHATFKQSCVSRLSESVSGEIWVVNPPIG